MPRLAGDLRPLLAAATAVVLLGFVGCVGEAEGETTPRGRGVVATQVPSGLADWRPEPGARYPAGSRLVSFDLEAPQEEPRVLTPGMTAAGGATPTQDGEGLLFVGKEQEQEPYSVWTCRLDGSERRKAVDAGADCGGAAALPDGRIVYSAATLGRAPRAGLSSAWALFVAPGDGSPGERITFSGGVDLDPTVLADGRVLFSSWQPAGEGRAEGGAFGLFTVHPDGTGVAPVHGNHGGPTFKLCPRQGPAGTLYFVDGSSPRILGTDWRAPREGGFEVAVRCGVPVAADPTRDGLLVASLPGEDSGGGLFLLDRTGALLRGPLLATGAWQVVHAFELRAAARPQGHMSMVKPETPYADLLCLDARPPGEERAARVRLRVSEGGGADGRVLGEVALEDDGSFFVRVPPDLPLLVDVLADDGEVLSRSLTPFWVRPKEVRGCVGCHEDPETAPPNTRPLAVSKAPVRLDGSGSGGGRR